MIKISGLLTCMILSQLISTAQSCPVPNTFFPDDTVVVCNGSDYTIAAPVIAGCTYLWSTDETTTSIRVTNNGRFWLQINYNDCVRTDTVTVLFNSFLLSPRVSDVKLCKGVPAAPLTAAGQHILWYDAPIGGTGSVQSPVPSTSDTGSVTYWVSQTIRGCESPRLPVGVKVIDRPKFDLGDAFIIPCDALGIVLQVVPDGESDYTWSNGSHDPSIIAPQRGQYWLYAENMCGHHSDTVVAVECKDKCVQLPTAFTPNSDGKNDLYQAACFCPVPKYRLAIFNRNGEMVFQTSDPRSGWNGYYNGKAQPNGVYVYVTEYFDFVLKKTFNEKGTFVLLR